MKFDIKSNQSDEEGEDDEEEEKLMEEDPDFSAEEGMQNG